MGAKQQTYATVREALAIIAHKRLSTARGVADPDAYYGRILTDLRASMHTDALAIVEAHPEITAAQLAERLEEGERSGVEAPNTSAALPVYEAPPWRPATPEERMKARGALAKAREALKEEK